MENYAIKPTSISKKYHVMYINKRGKKTPQKFLTLSSAHASSVSEVLLL